MNKYCYRVIFNRTLNRFDVVSELAKTEGKSTADVRGEAHVNTQISKSLIQASIKPLSFALFCALGFVSIAIPVQAEIMMIKPDANAASHERPVVVETANGIPQVNIQTPNQNGLSHNKYQQFDVDEKGAILNNSRKPTQTQQGGWVQGNPYLAGGEAKVIVNEVNSNKQSQLKGYVEVAGKKADVIIANPSGVHCEGCGVINAERATITTGKPEIKNGNLDGFVVEKGKVQVSGKGMDNSQSDYTDIIAQSAEINSGVWAKKELKVTTGKNRVSKNNDSVQIINSKNQDDNDNEKLAENSPHFALDVSALGGMYADKIHLIGTEAGLGVHNAGHIGAAAGEVQIDSAGKIVNKGLINAASQIQQQAKQGIENHGRIESKSADIKLNSQKHIQQDGVVASRGGDIHLNAKEGLSQTGETLARGNVSLEAQQISAAESSLIAAGVETQGNGENEQRQLEAQHAQGKQLNIVSQQEAQLNGKNLASGKLNVTASQVNLDQSQNSANQLEVQAKAGEISANYAVISAKDSLILGTPTRLSTQGSQLQAERIQSTQTQLDNQNGQWQQTGSADFALNAKYINNQGGQIGTAGNFKLQANKLENVQGHVLAGQALALDLGQSAFNSQEGILSAKTDLSLLAGAVDNTRGLIQAGNNLQLNTQGQDFINKDSLNAGLIALGNLSLQVGNLDNQQGRIVALGAGQTQAHALNNQAFRRKAAINFLQLILITKL